VVTREAEEDWGALRDRYELPAAKAPMRRSRKCRKKTSGRVPTANRGKQLRRLSPVTVYAALSELPRGAMNITKDAPD